MTNKPGTVAATTCPKILIKFVVDCIEAMCRQNSCLHNFFLFLFFKVKEREREIEMEFVMRYHTLAMSLLLYAVHRF